MSAATKRRTVRLWWRCSICRHRFDTFGVDHEDGRMGAALLALEDHFDVRHAELVAGNVNLRDLGALIEPDGATTRVVRRTLIAAPSPAGTDA